MPEPSATPMTPPIAASRAASSRNCQRMSRRRAPRARRTPISLVRSTTDTNMMLAITIAPTTSEIPEIRIISRKAHCEKFFQRVCSISAVTIPKGSSLSNFVGRRVGPFDASDRLDENRDVLRRRDVVLEQRQRDVDHVVAALAHHVALLDQSPHDLDGIALDLHHPTDRVLVGEELVLHIPAADRPGRRVVALAGRDVPPG